MPNRYAANANRYGGRIMIEQLDGTRETVFYQKNFPVRSYLNDTPEDYPIHWQPAIEVILPLENCYTVTVEGQPLLLQPGDVLLIAPGILHSIQAPESGSRYIFQIHPEPFSCIEGLEQIGSCLSPYVLFDRNCPEDVRGSLRDTMHALYHEYTGNQPFQSAAIYLHTLRLLTVAARNCSQRPVCLADEDSLAAHKYAQKFTELCNYINTHCTEPITLKEIASMSGFSLSHFIRLFKQFTGTTFYHYLNQCKIASARNLLSSYPDLSISEIAARCGFRSLATFNRLFRSIAQCTPTDYRDRLRS